MAQHQAGQLAKAEAAYRGAVTANGEFAEAHLNLGVVLHAQGNFDAALGPIRRALTLNPAMAKAHYTLADVITIGVLLAFPGIITWLPALLR